MAVEQSLAHIEEQYSGQWVVVRETEWDAHGEPTHGVVVAADARREALVPVVKGSEGEGKLFVCYAGPKIPRDLTVIL